MTNTDNNRLKSSAEADEEQQRRLGREQVQRVQQRNSVVDFYHSAVGPAFSEIFEELKRRFGAKRRLSQESHDAPHWEDAYESLTVKTGEEEEFFYKIMVEMVETTQTSLPFTMSRVRECNTATKTNAGCPQIKLTLSKAEKAANT
ncbi:MAG: hypothetical protein WCB79_01710 [Halobacteriota archaeon]